MEKRTDTQPKTYLTKIVNSFLQDRTIQVKIKDRISETTEEGLPQGSVIALTLLNKYINDIPKNNNTKLAMFADDTAIIAKSAKIKPEIIYKDT